MPPEHPPEIEVGAQAEDLRYWLAKEAVRQGEVRLSAQAQNIAAMESRATSILAWSTATMVALGAAASQGHLRPIAMLAGALLLAASIACIGALWPAAWHPPGHDFAALAKMRTQAPDKTELEVLELIAVSYEDGIAANDRRAGRFAWWLRAAWILFLAAPIAGAIRALLSAP